MRWSLAVRMVAIRHRALVGLAVASSVEAVADDTSRGRLDRAHAAQRSEGRFGGHSFGVVTGGDQQRSGNVGTYTGGG